MTTTIFNELTQIAIKAANYLNGLCSDSETFQVDGETLSAVIRYNAETKYYEGDYWTALGSVTENEMVTVEGIYDEDWENNKEYTEYLQKLLN